jgi:hypothetical protein
LILEGSKIKILMEKLGLSQTTAETLQKICGNLSVWMANKILGTSNLVKPPSFVSISPGIKDGYVSNFIRNYRSSIVGIIDYIRVHLNGDISSIKELSWSQLTALQHEWHESLQMRTGNINYDEKNEIIKDFRDSEGLGYYWVNLGTNNSPEECERMGHCGRSRSNLYSLRSFEKLSDKFTINRSHVTAAIDDDGVVTQMKGPKNSKPDEEYTKYIFPLLTLKNAEPDSESEYFINKFKSEYRPETDFQIWDLSKDQIKTLMSQRPDFFDGFVTEYKLYKLGLVDKSPFEGQDMNFKIHISPEDVQDYVRGDWTVRQRKNPHGGRDIKIGMFETILSGDFWGEYDYYNYSVNDIIDDVNEKNRETIWGIIKKTANEHDIEEIPEDLEDAITEFEDMVEIGNAMSSARNDCDESATYEYYYDTLKKTLSEYGEVIQMDDTGVTLKVNGFDLLPYLSDSDFEEIEETMKVENKTSLDIFLSYVFDYYQQIISHPEFSINNYWSPSCNDSEFNSYLSDRLADLG